MELIYVFDLLGTLVFAISGVLAAIEKKFDLVGASIIGFVTAVGGGTLRDMMIGETPVSWMKDLNFFAGAFYNVVLSISIVIIIRYLAVKKHWSLPFNPNP